MSTVSLRSYCNELEEIMPFGSKEKAQHWLETEGLSNDGITLLVPFQDKQGKIKFLKPNERAEANKKLRVIGMANHEHERNFFQKLKDCFEKHRVPHIGDIEGDDIIPDEPHGFLIVYKKGEHKVGRFFYKIFNQLNDKLIAEIRKSPTNTPNLQLNVGQLMESLSSAAFGLLKDEEASEFDIESGRMYFTVDGHLYRYTFRKDPSN